MTGIVQKGRYGRYLHHILTAIDFVVLNLVFVLTASLHPTFVADHGRTVWLLANGAFLPVVYWLGKTHKARSIHMDHVIANSIRAVVIHALIFISCLYFVGIDKIPWQQFLFFYSVFIIALPLWWTVSRLILKAYRRHGRNFSRVVIVGSNVIARRLYDELTGDVGFGYKMMGYFDNSPGNEMPANLYRGTLDSLDDFVRDNAVDEIFFSLSGHDEHALQKVITIADTYVARFYYAPQLHRTLTRNFELLALGTMPVLSIRRNPLSNLHNNLLKRLFDVVVSGTAILLSPIVLIPVGIAIKISSPGPIFFRQKRTGYRGREFECLKFRTMKVNADADRMQAGRDDPRKTKLGNFMRHYSIDELPQFWNVLIGDMSLVGPRPHMLLHTEEYSQLIDKYMVRHMVKPGITGWAQVNGLRGETKQLWQMERRVEHDIWYIEHWSMLLDIKIILRTVFNAVRGEKNAF